MILTGAAARNVVRDAATVGIDEPAVDVAPGVGDPALGRRRRLAQPVAGGARGFVALVGQLGVPRIRRGAAIGPHRLPFGFGVAVHVVIPGGFAAHITLRPFPSIEHAAAYGGIAIAAQRGQNTVPAPRGSAMAKTHGAAESGAIAMLAQDHKRVQKLFKDFEKVDRADEEALRDVVETACLELQIHSMLEEEIFYPAVRGQAHGEEQDDLLNASEVEHEAVEDLIARLHDLEADDPMYYAYFSVLVDFAKHHIRREEQSLFPLVEKMTDLDLDQLGEDMRVRREELFAEVERGEQESDAESADDDDDAGAVATLEEEDEAEELEDEAEQRDISRTRH